MRSRRPDGTGRGVRAVVLFVEGMENIELERGEAVVPMETHRKMRG